MGEASKATVLLADSDALRRDALASVLKSNAEIEIVAGCEEGMQTLDEIRNLRPDVAIVDLNLPGLHGIELIRRVRGEGLGTKIIIVSGTSDDEIVREVVRAGADAYLLKNGPVRHLTDAINYVRDGGQYFSPQLHRDGRDRHLLEEPPRVYPDAPPPRRDDYEPEYDDRRDDRRDVARRDDRGGYSRGDRRPSRRPRSSSDPARFRERFREETRRDLRDRDYDIMSEAAGPLLDRLEEIESRLVDMEEGAEDLPADPRSWLDEQLADTLGRGRGRSGGGRFDAREFEAKLPELIEAAVSQRFETMAGKLQEEIEEQHVKTLETFVKNIQSKLVNRVSALEQNMAQQAEAMHQLRDYNARTEANLSRLISGVDKLASDLPKRLAAAKAEADAGGSGSDEEERPRSRKKDDWSSESRSSREESRSKDKWVRKRTSSKDSAPLNIRIPKAVFVILGIILLVAVIIYQRRQSKIAANAAPPVGKELEFTQEKQAGGAPKIEGSRTSSSNAGGDTASRLDAAKQAADKKEYTTAEDIYKQILQSEPKNVEAIKGLASVYYREDKIDESTQMLDRLPKE